MLAVARPFLEQNMHPRIIVSAFVKALDVALKTLEEIAVSLDVDNKEAMLELVRSTLGTKFMSRFGDKVAEMAIDAVLKITVVNPQTKKKELDIKRYARVEKIPGGYFEDCQVLNGLMINKDVVEARMSRHKKNPRILLLDCPLEYKKGESQTNIEITEEDDWNAILKSEEAYIERLCNDIIKHKVDLVFTEKGCSDLAAHFLSKAGISVIRRLRKTDNNRIARATGATIVNEPSYINEADIGKECGLFEVKKIGDEYFTYLLECENPKACTIVLRGASKDVLMEMERNLHDAMGVVKTIVLDPHVLPGGGASEMAIGRAITEASKTITGVDKMPFLAVGKAMEVIPRTLIENCGGSVIRLLTALRAKHAEGPQNKNWGIDGNKGVLADMTELKVFDPLAVKNQTLKTAIESACMLLRIDDIVSGMADQGRQQQGGHDDDADDETFGDGRDG